MEGSKDAGVFRVMSFAIWSRERPTASLAAILAMGNPVALEARADDLLTLGFISMIMSCKMTGDESKKMFGQLICRVDSRKSISFTPPSH